MYTKEAFRIWLQEELERRDWTQADLAAASSMSPSLISKIIRGDRNLGFDSATAIARALQMPAETLLRQAGILPTKPEPSLGLGELNFLYDQLSDEDRKNILIYARALVREKVTPYVPKTKTNPAEA